MDEEIKKSVMYYLIFKLSSLNLGEILVVKNDQFVSKRACKYQGRAQSREHC